MQVVLHRSANRKERKLSERVPKTLAGFGHSCVDCRWLLLDGACQNNSYCYLKAQGGGGKWLGIFQSMQKMLFWCHSVSCPQALHDGQKFWLTSAVHIDEPQVSTFFKMSMAEGGLKNSAVLCIRHSWEITSALNKSVWASGFVDPSNVYMEHKEDLRKQQTSQITPNLQTNQVQESPLMLDIHPEYETHLPMHPVEEEWFPLHSNLNPVLPFCQKICFLRSKANFDFALAHWNKDHRDAVQHFDTRMWQPALPRWNGCDNTRAQVWATSRVSIDVTSLGLCYTIVPQYLVLRDPAHSV